MKRTCFALLGAAVFLLLAWFCLPHGIQYDPYGVYGGTIRLRVIANSDDTADQTVKYAVRDALIENAHGLFAECGSAEAAYDMAKASEDVFCGIASRTLAAYGVPYGARVRLVRQYCPVRSYGALTFPAGVYRTLLVELGEAKGKNWFCVMYPPLCLDMARTDVYAERGVFLRCGFEEGQIDALEHLPKEKETVRVRFALADRVTEWFTNRG